MSAIDDLKAAISKHGDHDLFNEKQWIRSCILELSDRIDALEKPVGIPSDWCQNGCGTRTMDGLPLKECPLCSGAPKPEDIEAAKSEAMAQSNFERKMRNNASPFGVPYEDDLPFSSAHMFDWRSFEIPRPSHDLSHAIELLTDAMKYIGGSQEQKYAVMNIMQVIDMLEALQKAGAK